MEGLKQRIEELVGTGFPGSELRWQEDNLIKRPSGTLVWEGFDGLSHIDRQQRLGAYLREHLGEDKTLIGMIFTLTPRERAAILQEA